MTSLKGDNFNYNLIHDNLNDQWLLADISPNGYQFYHKFRIPPEKPKKKISLKIFPISILVLVIFVLSIFIVSTSTISTNKRLFETYYSSTNIADMTRSDNVNSAILKFQEKDYKTASILFNNIIKQDSSNIAVQFYNGICLIETNNINGAINTFNSIIKQNDNLYIEHAEWYLGLCYLKNNQINLARQKFTHILNSEDSYHKKDAKEILEKLK